jgi:hypothetical protein
MILEIICIVWLILSGISLFIAFSLFGVLCREGVETGYIFFIISVILLIISLITGSYSVLQFIGVL